MESEKIQAGSKQSEVHEESKSGRPKRVCSRKSYCEVETDDEFTAEDVKHYKSKGEWNGTDLKSLPLAWSF